MVYTIESACINHMGYIRENNEDNFYFDGRILDLEHESMEEPMTDTFTTSKMKAVAVFDGMGGENAGEIASFTAAKKFRDICQLSKVSKSGFLRMMKTLNLKVCTRAKQDKLGQIGTTASILFFHSGYVYVTNVGDSPAYILRRGRLKLISEKHTNEELLRLSNIKNRKPALTQFLGIPEDEMSLEPYLAGIEVQEGDVFLICSDGLTDMVPEDEIQRILNEGTSSADMVVDLLCESLMKGGHDNITIICSRVSETHFV